MEFKKLDENRFQCLLEKEDLEENNISLDDFFKNDTAKIHGLLDVVMEEAQKNIDVEIDRGVMALQLTPQPNQSILLTISSASDDFGEMLKQVGEKATKTLLSKSQKGSSKSNVIKNPANELSESPFKEFSKEEKKKNIGLHQNVKSEVIVAYFEKLEDVEDFCEQCPKTWGVINELYKDVKGCRYYLVLKRGRCSEQKYKSLAVSLPEYAECESSGEKRVLWIEEHCEKMIAGNAINTIKKYCGGNHTC